MARSPELSPVALTNRQIERYSRQIIVEKFGGVAQERLLAARILLIANYADAEPTLAYLVGAGVGNLYLHAKLDSPVRERVIEAMRDLNSDSTVVIGDAASFDSTNVDLALSIMGDEAALEPARALSDRPSDSALVIARLDSPAKLAVIPSRPPCLRCANGGELLAPFGPRSDNAGFITMLAALEAIKLLTRYSPSLQPMLIEFNGYQSSLRTLGPSVGFGCVCGSIRGTKASE